MPFGVGPSGRTGTDLASTECGYRDMARGAPDVLRRRRLRSKPSPQPNETHSDLTDSDEGESDAERREERAPSAESFRRRLLRLLSQHHRWDVSLTEGTRRAPSQSVRARPERRPPLGDAEYSTHSGVDGEDVLPARKGSIDGQQS
jgi:hypothetical protein